MEKKIAVLVLSLFLFSEHATSPASEYDCNRAVASFLEDKDEEWECLVWAICEKESGHDDGARNPKSSASGRFQMLKMYVDDANRIIGENRYSYKDRFNPVKAREMFDIIQGFYNPKKDIGMAVRLHSGTNDKDYFKDIKRKMLLAKETGAWKRRLKEYNK